MNRPAVALFCMADRSHFHRVRSLIAGFSRIGVPICVFTHRRFQAEIEQAGAVFADLFAHGSVEETDDESWPHPVRFVTFAARFAEQIGRDVEAFGPSIVIGDTFAVITRVIANRLGIPYVNVCAGHNVVPAKFVAIVEAHPRVKVSARCLEAVGVLKNRYGMLDISPFSYASGLSQHLNIYCEPPAFLDAAEREVFQPIAFYGSLPALDELERVPTGESCFAGGDERLKVYLSFGTIIWPIREAEALAALRAFVDCLERFGNASAVISLGSANVDPRLRAALVRPGVSVETYVDQWKILQEADLFVTHHGMNSTHEAIFHRVPMISYPFAWDQPGLASKCQRLGLAVPVVDEPMAEIDAADADRALRLVQQGREKMLGALAVAAAWEREVVAGRPAVLEQILDLGR